MSERPVKPKKYFAKLLAVPEDKIDYTDSPPTTRADWEGAEVLVPITSEEFRAILDLRRNKSKAIAKVDADEIKKVALLGAQFPGIYLFDGPATELDPLIDVGHIHEHAKRRSEIEKDPYDALQFFLSKVFYGGGLDDAKRLSFYRRAKQVLDNGRLFLFKPDFNPSDLEPKLKIGGVNNPNDRKMVIAAVELARNLHSWGDNIISYTLNVIFDGRIIDIRERILHRGARGVHGIGPNRASVFLRDVVMIWDIERNLKSDEDLICCVPIDTHVRQTCERVGIRVDSVTTPCNDEESDRSLAKAIIDACKNCEASPLFFDAGAWMSGMARKRIKIDPQVMGGKPVIRGTRIPIEQILRKLEAGIPEDDVMADHPKLTLDDIRAAQVFSAVT